MKPFSRTRRNAVLTIVAAAAATTVGVQGASAESAPILTRDPKLESVTVTVDGQQIAVLRGGAGPAIVLVHSAGQGKAAGSRWQELVTRLAKRGTVLSVALPALERAAGGRNAEAAQLAKLLGKLVTTMGLEAPFVVANGAGVAVAYALARGAPAAVRGLVLLDTMVPGIAPLGASPHEHAWVADARRNAAHREATDQPLVFALGEKSPYASEIAMHAVALREHGWNRVYTALVPLAARDVVSENTAEVGELIEQHLP